MNETIAFTNHQKLLPLLELVLLIGSDRGKRILLTGGRQTFGRSDDNNIILVDSTISNHHGVLVYADQGEVIFYDTASRNGISLDGKKATIIKAKVGEQIQIGSVYLKLVRAGQEIEAVPEIRRKRFLKAKWLAGSVLAVSLAGLAVFLVPFWSHPQRAPETVSIPIASTVPAVAGIKKVMRRKSIDRKPVAAHPSPSREQGRVRLKGIVQVDQFSEQARTAFQNGRFAEAFSLWKQILSLDPSNVSAQEGLQKLETVAGRFYEDALMTKGSSPDQCKQKLQLAMSITDPGSQIHQRAATLMKGQG